MSFILDALKKSESERQRQSVPGLMDARSAPQRRGLPPWAIVTGALLALLVAVLGTLQLRQALHPARAAQAAAAPAPVSAATAATPARPATATGGADQAHFSPMDAAPAVYAPEIPVDQGPGGHEAAPSAPPARPSAQRSGPAAQATDGPIDEVLPELSELNLGGGQALPDLHLDVHVYATNPADRFVYINMHRYREGSVVSEGLTIERIRRDGVVMDYQGLRFLLPRQ